MRPGTPGEGMLPAPGVYPRENPRPTGSRAEVRVYEALRAKLPPGWYAWHSLRVQTRAGWCGEGDFIIAEPRRGLLVLEVKGGTVELRDGHWWQNELLMARGPRKQAFRLRRLLLERLADAHCEPPAHGIATCFPDAAFSAPPSQDDLAGTTLGEQDLRWLDQVLPSLVDRALPAPGSQRGNWLGRLHELWGETWKPRLTLGHRARNNAEDRVMLDAGQLTILDGLQENSRVLVEGAAGSGKTLLAREAALRLAGAGRRVLLLTFTKALALWLRECTTAAGLEVAPIRGFALTLLGRAALEASPPSDASGWEEVSLRAGAEALLRLDAPCDAVVLDEAQDLGAGDWVLVEELARGKPLWAFHDPAQRYWTEREIPLHLFATRFRLPHAHRCHAAIQALADRYAGRPADDELIRAGLADGTLAIVDCPSESSVARGIGVEIDRLRADGLAPGDIAVVSLRGRDSDSVVTRNARFGAHPVVPADNASMGSAVVADTFLRFKGLERPAVIVTDLGWRGQQHPGVRMHIALSRALVAARIVAPRDVIREDPVLAGLAARSAHSTKRAGTSTVAAPPAPARPRPSPS